jgi:hypothetical protein
MSDYGHGISLPKLTGFEFHYFLITGIGLAPQAIMANYGERNYRAIHKQYGWHAAPIYPSLSQLLQPICLEEPILGQQRSVCRLFSLPVVSVHYRAETGSDANSLAESVEAVQRYKGLQWPHYRDVTTLEPEGEDFTFTDELPHKIGEPVEGDALFPRLWKLIGTVTAIALGLLLGALATAL